MTSRAEEGSNIIPLVYGILETHLLENTLKETRVPRDSDSQLDCALTRPLLGLRIRETVSKLTEWIWLYGNEQYCYRGVLNKI